MAATHPASLRELFEWMAEDTEVNRRRGGMLSVVAVIAFRMNQFGARGTGVASAIARIASLPLVAFARLGIGVELPGSLACGRRLVLAHGGREVILHPDARLGDDVALASGCGAGAVVGAHALVTRSIPAGMLAVGVPAKVVGPAPSTEPPAVPEQRGPGDELDGVSVPANSRRSSW
jgi:serine acetyltransferase